MSKIDESEHIAKKRQAETSVDAAVEHLKAAYRGLAAASRTPDAVLTISYAEVEEELAVLLDKLGVDALALLEPTESRRVWWAIDVAAATAAEAAARPVGDVARKALTIQRDPASVATVFEVEGPEGLAAIDLDPEV